MTAPPHVSLVVASHRPDYLRELLHALQRQTTGDLVIETIIVTDYPNDSVAGCFPAIRFIYLNNYSISAKRNQGIRASRGPLIAFTDDDCIPAPDWIRRATQSLDNHQEWAGVEGRTRVEDIRGDTGAASQFRRLEHRGYRTNNICYRRTALDRAGLFDERFTVQREDLDLALTIIEQGGAIGYNPAMCVLHRHRAGERWDLLKNCWNRRFDPLLFRKHPARYRSLIGSPVPGVIRLVGAAHTAVLCSRLIGAKSLWILLGADLLATMLVAARRVWQTRSSPAQIARELTSVALAPAVIAYALLYGSVRFRRLLLL